MKSLHAPVIPPAVALGIFLASCVSGPPPDEGQFRNLVADRLVNRLDGTDPVRIIVIDPALWPKEDPELVATLQQELDGAGLAWVAVDLEGDLEALPGEWTTLPSSSLRFNRTHAMLSVTIDGRTREKIVEWGYHCGPVCGFGEIVRYHWIDGRWTSELLVVVAY